MNEVSNGPSIGAGTKEYVEFVVISNTVSYDCNNTAPPCIDIRGWIFDDNSGYHGPDGKAAGAVRFSQNALWSCIPLGTIILIYNAADKNPAIPADDITMSDGNCRIVAPVDGALFEVNLTTPGASACSYPATGWTPATISSWTATALANGGDCARIVNLSGCEVFSVCYGTDNLNTQIYYSGSGSQRVYYFNGIDPNNQANWTNGNASLVPGDQTPGFPNNAANAAYIGQFNNNCMPITSLSVTATSINAGCTCNGSATANATGSIGGYTYVWYDTNFNPIGQTNATATNLCAGIYNVIATSHIGCTKTASVTITSVSSNSVSVNSQTICAGNSAILTATSSVSEGTFSWSTGGQTSSTISVNPSSTTTYSVTYSLAGCSSIGFGTVTVNQLPIITVNSSTICNGKTTTLSANGANTFTWNTGATSSTINASPTTNTNYTVTGETNGCINSNTTNITVVQLPIVSVNSPTICSGQTASLTANGANTYVWNTGSTSNSLNSSPSSNTNYTVVGTISGCTNSAISSIVVNTTPTITVNSTTICSGQTATLSANGAINYNWNTGETSSSIIKSPTATTIYSVTGSSLGCFSSATSTITINSNINLTVNSPTLCAGQTTTLIANGASTYTWSTGATSNSIIASPSNTTIYSFTGNINGCSGSLSSTVNINPSPVALFNSDLTFGCAPLCVQFSDLSSITTNSITSWNWSFDNSSTSNNKNPLYCFNDGGLHDISLEVTSSNGCKTKLTINDMINVFEKPNALFSTNINVTDISEPTVLFYNQSTNATTYNWNFGDANTSTETNPNHTYSLEGTYTTTLTATNQNGCSDIRTKEIIVNGLFTFYAPNTFTPNNDDVNDIFLPLGIGWDSEKYNLNIFDRWGGNCFSTTEINKGWDGKIKNAGEIAPIGSYTWKVELKDVYGIRHKYIGLINIVK